MNVALLTPKGGRVLTAFPASIRCNFAQCDPLSWPIPISQAFTGYAVPPFSHLY